MPWQPSHIWVFTRPASALPTGALACAAATAGTRRANAHASTPEARGSMGIIVEREIEGMRKNVRRRPATDCRVLLEGCGATQALCIRARDFTGNALRRSNTKGDRHRRKTIDTAAAAADRPRVRRVIARAVAAWV